MVFENFVNELLPFIVEYGVIAVMLGMVIEEVIVPIPSPVIPMAAGFLLVDAVTIPAALIQILFLIALPASIASVVSSYFVYGVAYKGGKPMIERYGRYMDLSWEDVQQLEDHFESDNEKYYVALFRAVPVVPLSLISGSAGLFRMNWKQYGIWSFIGMMPRNFILAYIGWTVKDDFMRLASQIDTVSTAVALSVAFVVGSYLGYRKLKEVHRYMIRYTAQ